MSNRPNISYTVNVEKHYELNNILFIYNIYFLSSTLSRGYCFGFLTRYLYNDGLLARRQTPKPGFFFYKLKNLST
jgi:hypothetical protein